MYDGMFQFYQNNLIQKILEATGVDHNNGFSQPTKSGSPLGTYKNVPKLMGYFF